MDGGQVEAAADPLAGLKSRARALSGDAAVRAWRDVLVQSAGDREAHKALRLSGVTPQRARLEIPVVVNQS